MMKCLQKFKNLLMLRFQENEGHTEQGVFLILIFISDVLQIGIGLMKRRIHKALRYPADGKDALILHKENAVTYTVVNTIKKAFYAIPVYVLEEESIINLLINEKIISNSNAKFLGFDCEWVNDGSVLEKVNEMKADGFARAPVALLQISTISECFLIRLCHLKSCIPKALKEVLEDKSILKFGVGVDEDCRRLRMLGVNIQGSVDIRFLVQRSLLKTDIIKNPERVNGLSLKSLAGSILGIEMEKSYRVRCSNWEIGNLTEKQVAYAANDAIIGLQIFLALCMQKVNSKAILRSSEYLTKSKVQVSGQQLLVMSFLQGKAFLFNQSKLCLESFNIWEHFTEANLVHEEIAKRGSSLCQGVVGLAFKNKNRITLSKPKQSASDSCFAKLKKSTIPVRKKPLYHNCLLIAPDGTVLCTCDKKKADWYIIKDIGKVVNEDPFTVQLSFQPSGRPFVDRDYYTTEKENKCVVCGKAEDYVKKMVVPRDYRRHFPAHLKNHLSHDVLLLCIMCHRISELHDMQLKEKLAMEYNAPVTGGKSVDVPELKRVRSAAKALLNSAKQIPEERKANLRKILQDFTQHEFVDNSTMQQLADIGTTRENEHYQGAHGEQVVAKLAEKGQLNEFVKMWREHFLYNMKPKFLPTLWSTEHNLTNTESEQQ